MPDQEAAHFYRHPYKLPRAHEFVDYAEDEEETRHAKRCIDLSRSDIKLRSVNNIRHFKCDNVVQLLCALHTAGKYLSRTAMDCACETHVQTSKKGGQDSEAAEGGNAIRRRRW